MRRRTFASLACGVATASAIWTARLDAQPRAMPVIGWLSSGGPPGPSAAPNLADFRQGLAESGFVDGRTVAFENRWAGDLHDRLPALAADLVGREVGVIVTVGDPAAHAARNATATIPIVFIVGDDPVAAGLVASLARPGGNLTGLTVLTGELNPKRFDLLRELVPGIGTIGLLVNPNNVASGRVIRDMEEATRRGAVQLDILMASGDAEIDAAFASLARRRVGALLVDADLGFNSRRERIVAQAARHAIAAVYGSRGFVEAGGLISFATKVRSVFRQAGVYTGKILRGARPADLPVQQPTTFELVINLRTARTLGLRVPPSILARADEVIE